MASFQKYVAMGPLVRDLEVFATKAGEPWCRFTIAVEVGWGERRDTLFVSCKCFGTRAKALAKFAASFPKGAMIVVEGKWQREEYEKDGVKQKHYGVIVDEWHFAGKKGETVEAPAPPKQESFAGSSPATEDDGLPF